MNRKLFMVLAILLVGIVGIAAAVEYPEASATQSITAEAIPWQASITAPIAVSEWDLVRGGDNDKWIGNVAISSDAPTSWIMSLTATANTDTWISGPLSMTSEAPYETAWQSLLSGGIATLTPIGGINSPNNLATKTTIPVYLRQSVTDQPDGVYTLTVTYTLSVTPPPA